jgi:hypothetical protein
VASSRDDGGMEVFMEVFMEMFMVAPQIPPKFFTPPDHADTSRRAGGNKGAQAARACGAGPGVSMGDGTRDRRFFTPWF